MSDKRVIIERSDTGAELSVVEADFKKHYPDVRYKVLHPETPGDFIAKVPRAPRRQGARRKTAKAATPAKRPAATPTEAPSESAAEG